jgi:hypothetical protein
MIRDINDNRPQVKHFLAVFWIRDIFGTDPDADPGGPKTYGSGSGCGSGTLVKSHKKKSKKSKSRTEIKGFLTILLEDGGSEAGSVL